MKNNIAKVVVGLPIDSSFDYSLPQKFSQRAKIGCRVWVPFANKKLVGYIVGFSPKSKFKNIKSIISFIDEEPILEKDELEFFKDFGQLYCCSLGEAIESGIPSALKRGKPIKLERNLTSSKEASDFSAALVQDFSVEKRWEVFLKEIKGALELNSSVIFLVPEASYIPAVLVKLKANFANRDIVVFNSRQSQNKQLASWEKARSAASAIVVGTRSAIFAPLRNLKLIIIDEEDNSSYKQEQTPFYNTRDVALMRARNQNAKLFLASIAPSLEAHYLAERNKFKFMEFGACERLAAFKIIDITHQAYERRRMAAISIPLEDSMRKVLIGGGRVILFINRKGFSNIIRCRKCNFTLKCKRCNVSLTYHFDKKKLICRFCNYKIDPPQLCPQCQNSYMRYSGMGTEKLESEVNRLFPDKRILRLDKETGLKDDKFDILIATQIILKDYSRVSADLVGVVDIDSSLNRFDFRAAEKTFSLLIKLGILAKHQIIIQTHNPKHYSILCAAEKDFHSFYREELKLRRSLSFPPFRHFISVMLRGRDLEAVKDFSFLLFEDLNKENKTTDTKIYEPVPDIPDKLRGAFRWHILINGKDVKKINLIIKNVLKKIGRKSGIIVTINVDV